MRGRLFITVSTTWAMVLGALIFQTVSARQAIPDRGPRPAFSQLIWNRR